MERGGGRRCRGGKRKKVVVDKFMGVHVFEGGVRHFVLGFLFMLRGKKLIYGGKGRGNRRGGGGGGGVGVEG